MRARPAWATIRLVVAKMSSGQAMLAREQQLIPECVRYSLEFERLGGGRSEDAGSGDGHVPMGAAGGLEMMRCIDSLSHSPHPHYMLRFEQ